MAKILVVEDDEAMRVFLAKALERVGHDVETAPDAESADALLRSQVVDLLLADIELPGDNGVELARRAVHKNPDLCVLFVTGFDELASQANGFLAKKSCILSKPFYLSDLTHQVSTMLKGVAPPAIAAPVNHGGPA
jgi:two-component system, cell cycle response regulator CpdR